MAVGTFLTIYWAVFPTMSSEAVDENGSYDIRGKTPQKTTQSIHIDTKYS